MRLHDGCRRSAARCAGAGGCKRDCGNLDEVFDRPGYILMGDRNVGKVEKERQPSGSNRISGCHVARKQPEKISGLLPVTGILFRPL